MPVCVHAEGRFLNAFGGYPSTVESAAVVEYCGAGQRCRGVMPSRVMTTRQVSHLWGNGGTVEGEVGCTSLSEEEHVPRHESDTTWTQVSPNSLTNGHYQIWNRGY
jgi:hypothetical protein